jgi:hypothetical protein
MQCPERTQRAVGERQLSHMLEGGAVRSLERGLS